MNVSDAMSARQRFVLCWRYAYVALRLHVKFLLLVLLSLLINMYPRSRFYECQFDEHVRSLCVRCVLCVMRWIVKIRNICFFRVHVRVSVYAVSRDNQLFLFFGWMIYPYYVCKCVCVVCLLSNKRIEHYDGLSASIYCLYWYVLFIRIQMFDLLFFCFSISIHCELYAVRQPNRKTIQYHFQNELNIYERWRWECWCSTRVCMPHTHTYKEREREIRILRIVIYHSNWF